MDSLSLLYIPMAIALGALHALEPGHAKTLTAAYLIGIRGTRRDAALLGLSVAATHSIVVVVLCATALYIGQETFTEDATHFLQIASGIIVIALGAWLLWKRWRILARVRAVEAAHAHHHDHHHEHEHDHDHDHECGCGHDHHHDDDHDHDLMTDEEHARAHAATLPTYVSTGERPTALQIMTFGAAGGLIPCPASVSVMLLALSLGEMANGLILVLGFSAGLAIALVGVGLLVVAGLTRIAAGGRFSHLTRYAPMASAGVVILSGVAALVFAH